MRRHLFVIVDTLADDVAGAPLTLRNEPEAVRFFRDLLEDGNSSVGKHPHDHVLHKLGEVISKDGKTYIDTTDAKVVLTGSQWVQMMTEVDDA